MAAVFGFSRAHSSPDAINKFPSDFDGAFSLLKKIDHIAIATLDIDAALKRLGLMGPVRLGRRETIAAFDVEAIMVACGDAPIELIQPTSEDSKVAKFIKSRGEGIHHVAYRVEDMTRALEHCRINGVRLIDEKPRGGYAGSLVAFLHPKDMLGVLTELVQRPAGRDEPPYDPV